MRKVLLTQTMRRTLVNDATSLVDPKAERETLKEAYDRVAPMLEAIVIKKYPVDEMAILRKWGRVRELDTFSFQFHNHVTDQFTFDHNIVKPDSYDYSIMLVDSEHTYSLFDKWKDAQKAYKAEKSARVHAYENVIRGSRYLEDVASVWPEVVRYAPSPSLPILLNPEQVELVKADLAERGAL